MSSVVTLHDANVAGGFSYTCVVEDDEHSENILSLAADTEYSQNIL